MTVEISIIRDLRKGSPKVAIAFPNCTYLRICIRNFFVASKMYSVQPKRQERDCESAKGMRGAATWGRSRENRRQRMSMARAIDGRAHTVTWQGSTGDS